MFIEISQMTFGKKIGQASMQVWIDSWENSGQIRSVHWAGVLGYHVLHYRWNLFWWWILCLKESRIVDKTPTLYIYIYMCGSASKQEHLPAWFTWAIAPIQTEIRVKCDYEFLRYVLIIYISVTLLCYGEIILPIY